MFVKLEDCRGVETIHESGDDSKGIINFLKEKNVRRSSLIDFDEEQFLFPLSRLPSLPLFPSPATVKHKMQLTLAKTRLTDNTIH